MIKGISTRSYYNISKIIEVLEENYGERFMEEDLGVYVDLLENSNDIVELKKEK
ncbi:hypothetical protein [Clostridium culturomicium]|uniref:hypothetical protein n=1 Tax=Clostridium culturomicium TaxID=1499683 RepID=UPI000A5CECCC|nr:hypothetical protein [Clostridium culturomicium]